MLERETLDAVFVVVGYRKRPAYPAIALACLQAGVNVWIEKPPAASCAELETLRRVSVETGKLVGVGLKKMFFPANEKAMELTRRADFGRVSWQASSTRNTSLQKRNSIPIYIPRPTSRRSCGSWTISAIRPP